MSAAETHNPASVSARKPLWRRAWPLGVLALAAGAAFWLSLQTWRQPPPNGGLVVDAKYLDFGEAWEDSKFSWKIPIRNAGRSKVEVLNFATSCSCASINPREFTLAPQETREVHIDINLALGPPAADKKHVQPFEAMIVPILKGNIARPSGWTVKGRVKKVFTVSPPALAISYTPGNDHTTATISVEQYVPLAELRAKVEEKRDHPSPFLVEVEKAKAGHAVKLTLQGPVSPDALRFQLDLLPIDKSGIPLPGAKVPIEINVIYPVYPVPDVIALGDRKIGAQVTEKFFLHSRTDQPYIFKGVKDKSGGDIIIRPLPKAGEFELTVRVTKSGDQRERILLQLALGKTSWEVPVFVCYSGVEEHKKCGQ
jgi:hypothetical protein